MGEALKAIYLEMQNLVNSNSEDKRYFKTILSKITNTSQILINIERLDERLNYLHRTYNINSTETGRSMKKYFSVQYHQLCQIIEENSRMKKQITILQYGLLLLFLFVLLAIFFNIYTPA